jgi:predicted Zn-dependent peptidase
MTVRYRKTRLDNGIRIVTETMPWVRSVSIGIWLASGSRHEPARLDGISHFLEHMAFKGTRRRSTHDIALSLESLGGHLNAFTEKEFTCYCALVLDEHLPQAVDVLSDILQYPAMAEKDLKSEKGIIAEEIRNLEDTPEDNIHDLYIQTVFSGNPMGEPILGTEKSLKRMKRADLLAHRDSQYTYQNCIVAAAGNLDHDALVRMVGKHIRGLSEAEPVADVPAVFGGERHRTVQAPISQSHLCVGVPGLSYVDERKFPLLVLDTYFGGGMSSRLFQNLREDKGIAYSIYSFLDFWSDVGLWGVYTGTSPDACEKALKAIRKEYRALLDEGIPESALNRVKSQIIGNLLLMFEDTGNRMNRLAKMEAYTQSYFKMEGVIERVRSVKRKDIHAVAEALLGGAEQFTVILEPKTDA